MMTTLSDSITPESSWDGLYHLPDISQNGWLVSEMKKNNLLPQSPVYLFLLVFKATKSKWLKSTIFAFIKNTEKKISLQSSSLKLPEESILGTNGKLSTLLVVTSPLPSAEPPITTDHSTQKNLLKSDSQDLDPTKLLLWSKSFMHFPNNLL